MRVKKFTNGNIEVDFYHGDKITEYRFSSDSSGQIIFLKY
jgi:hypothetical protein